MQHFFLQHKCLCTVPIDPNKFTHSLHGAVDCPQAKQDRFKAAVGKQGAGNIAEEHTPLLVDRRNPFKPLDMDTSLQNSVLKEPVLEFAAIFSSIKLLPTAVANAVPSQASGAALAPPAAFQVTNKKDRNRRMKQEKMKTET